MPAWPVRLVVATITLLLSVSAFAGAPLVTTEFTGEYLGERTQVLDATDETYTVQQVRNLPSGRWQTSTQEIPSFGYSSDSFWFRLNLHNPKEHATSLVLELGYALLDEVQFFQFKDGKQVKHIVSGDRVPFTDREVQHRSFVFPIDIAPGETLECGG